jgi:hypothetical protein
MSLHAYYSVRIQSRETEKIVMSSTGLGTKNDCAGEGQRQFTTPNDRPISSGVVARP